MRVYIDSRGEGVGLWARARGRPVNPKTSVHLKIARLNQEATAATSHVHACVLNSRRFVLPSQYLRLQGFRV